MDLPIGYRNIREKCTLKACGINAGFLREKHACSVLHVPSSVFRLPSSVFRIPHSAGFAAVRGRPGGLHHCYPAVFHSDNSDNSDSYSATLRRGGQFGRLLSNFMRRRNPYSAFRIPHSAFLLNRDEGEAESAVAAPEARAVVEPVH